jgi:hypothetical protein
MEELQLSCWSLMAEEFRQFLDLFSLFHLKETCSEYQWHLRSRNNVLILVHQICYYHES